MSKKPHIILVGNEKGGTGKSTVSMHIIVSLIQKGFYVGSIDLDGRQGTLTRYIENRVSYAKKHNIDICSPIHIAVTPGEFSNPISCNQDVEKLYKVVEELSKDCDVIVMDAPGAFNHLFKAGHLLADTLITPLNDSLIDLDVLGKVDSETKEVVKPSHYAELIWKTKLEQSKLGKKPLDWIVLRNRLSHLKLHNKTNMKIHLEALAKKVGFRNIEGLGERVIFRELFLEGLTVLDVRNANINKKLSMSHIAATREIETLIQAISFDGQKNILQAS
jgi:chromosome partitioning protein